MKHIRKVEARSIEVIFQPLLGYADTFSFIVRTKDSSKITELLSTLQQYFISSKMVLEWPGTIQLTNAVQINYYQFTPGSLFVLSNVSDDLFTWIEPDLPEDIVLYKEARPIFISITHECEAFYELEESEIQIIPGE